MCTTKNVYFWTYVPLLLLLCHIFCLLVGVCTVRRHGNKRVLKKKGGVGGEGGGLVRPQPYVFCLSLALEKEGEENYRMGASEV